MNRPLPSSGPTVRTTRGGRFERWFLEPREVLEQLRELGALEAAQDVADTCGVPLLAALAPPRRTREAEARHRIIRAVVAALGLSIRRAALAFGLDRTSIRYVLRSAP